MMHINVLSILFIALLIPSLLGAALDNGGHSRRSLSRSSSSGESQVQVEVIYENFSIVSYV
jgi:hypothetical protein